jgi:hypothetical protein
MRDSELPTIQTGQATTDPESEGEKKDSRPPFLRMFESDEAIESSAKMQVNMQYSTLFADLNLPSDVEEEVRAILADSLADTIRLGVKAMQGAKKEDIPTSQSPDAIAEALRVELKKVLNADEMAVWEEYEANKDFYVLEQSYDMQLDMYAPSMSQETRDTVCQVMAEEMISAREEYAGAGDSGTDRGMTIQSDAMDRSLERLIPVLSEEEFAQVERFMQQQSESMRASLRMMQSMMGTEEEADAEP